MLYCDFCYSEISACCTRSEFNGGLWLLAFPNVSRHYLSAAIACQCENGGCCSSCIEVVGANTFGIYMLHMIGLVLMSRLQALPVFSCLGNMNSILVTLMNIVMALFVFLGCLIVSVLLRRIPVVGRLFFSIKKIEWESHVLKTIV